MRKKFEIIALLVGALLGIVAQNTLWSIHSDRRFTVYNIMRELHRDMSRQQVEAVINRRDTPFLHKHVTESGIGLRVDLGGANSCILTIGLTDGRLGSARIRGEDGPHETFSDAPPDI